MEIPVVYIEKGYSNEKINHIGYYIRSQIQNSELLDEQKNILLNYPVVYIHTWTKAGKRYVYVGETIDLVRRSNEHAKKALDDQDKVWQKKWHEGENLTAIYFSHKEMNKSLALDLEDSLISLFQALLGDKYVKNGRGNEYKGYSNCDLKKDMLLYIWNYLQQNSLIVDKSFDTMLQCKTDLAQKVANKVKLENAPDFVVYRGKYNPDDNLDTKIKEVLPQIEEQQVILDYPVVYLHVWTDSEGKNTQAYVGEAFDVIQRTTQHRENNDNNLSYDENLIFEENPSWRDEWLKSSNRYMFIFGSKNMNKSLTLDLENMLIKYLELCDISKNGRTNEQHEYGNRGELFPLLEKIVDIVSSEQSKFSKENKFIAKEKVSDKSVLISSPFLDFSKAQRDAIYNVKCNIVKKHNDLTDKNHSVMVIQGRAGTGKTVIASSLFFDLYEDKELGVKFLINSDELKKVYSKVSDGKSLLGAKYKNISKSIVSAQNYINEIQNEHMKIILPYVLDTEEKVKTLEKSLIKRNGDFGNSRSERIKITVCKIVEAYEGAGKTKRTVDSRLEKIAKECAIVHSGYEIEHLYEMLKKQIPDIEELKCNDVVLIDEAHLMSAKGHQGTIKDAQLPYIAKHTKTTVLLFDENQFVDNNAVWGVDGITQSERFENFFKKYYEDISDISIEFITELDCQYRMRCSKETERWIKELAKQGATINKSPVDEKGYEIKIFNRVNELVDAIETKKNDGYQACLVATYNWGYKDCFKISEDSYRFKWHKTGEPGQIWTKKKSLKDENVEVGYYKDIQGFDLEYVGVIIGPSYSYSEEKGVQIDPLQRSNIQSIVSNKETELVENELKVLLTRGIKGVYIYAVDDALREKLIEATNKIS